MDHIDKRKILVVSAVNFFQGGPLTILKECLQSFDSSILTKEYKVLALVHDKKMFEGQEWSNVELLEYPEARKSYFNRLKLEYFAFNRLAREKQVHFWLSLHDITPRLSGIPQAVYCHNPSPFRKIRLKDLLDQPTIFLFSLFYKYLYRINIHQNKFVIVQQSWMREQFKKLFHLPHRKVIVAQPSYEGEIRFNPGAVNLQQGYNFFFPTIPRSFKNIETIAKAVEILEKDSATPKFNVIITVDGTENRYAQKIKKKYGHLRSLSLIGAVSKEMVYSYYSNVDCLIFPSYLETWGLPISEFKRFNKPMLIADLPYARETVGLYDKVRFFDPVRADHLARLMLSISENSGNIPFDKTAPADYTSPFIIGWEKLFDFLLNSHS